MHGGQSRALWGPQVFGPIVMAANLATMGMAATASATVKAAQAGVQAAKEGSACGHMQR